MCSYVFHSCSLDVDQGLDWTIRCTGCVWKFIRGVLLCFWRSFRSSDKNISVFFINKLFVNMNSFGKYSENSVTDWIICVIWLVQSMTSSFKGLAVSLCDGCQCGDPPGSGATNCWGFLKSCCVASLRIDHVKRTKTLPVTYGLPSIRVLLACFSC